MAHKQTKFQPKRGDVVIVQSESKNRGSWPLAIVEEMYPGKDGVVRAVRVKTPNGTLDTAVQQLYPLELKCDVAEKKTVQLNPDATSLSHDLREMQLLQRDGESENSRRSSEN